MFLLVATQAVPLDTSSISGIVSRSGTAEPLDLVVVSLIPEGGAAAPPSVETDSTGRFSFRNVPPGRYAVSVRREGYFGPPRHGATGGINRGRGTDSTGHWSPRNRCRHYQGKSHQ